MHQDTTRICLWSSPRNVSTAFMYSWAQRPDCMVVDEPLYGYYLTKAGPLHPGREEIMASMECDAEKVIYQMAYGDYPTPVVFFKHMSHHMLTLPLDWMNEMVNLFFIRDPGRIIASYAEVIDSPSLDDIGIGIQWEQYLYAESRGYKSIVLDSGILLQSPNVVLHKLCNIIGIPFYTEMLQWPTGPRKEDGIWAKYWYAQVHQTKGFEIVRDKALVIPERLKGLYEEAMAFYEKMKGLSITLN